MRHKASGVLSKISFKSHFIDTMVKGIISIILPQMNLLNGLAGESLGKKEHFYLKSEDIVNIVKRYLTLPQGPDKI